MPLLIASKRCLAITRCLTLQVNGLQYLDKIIHIPFCIPGIPGNDRQQYVKKVLNLREATDWDEWKQAKEKKREQIEIKLQEEEQEDEKEEDDAGEASGNDEGEEDDERKQEEERKREKKVIIIFAHPSAVVRNPFPRVVG